MDFRRAFPAKNFTPSETFLKIPLVGKESLDTFRVPPRKVGRTKRKRNGRRPGKIEENSNSWLTDQSEPLKSAPRHEKRELPKAKTR
jgi:hypothetical protein